MNWTRQAHRRNGQGGVITPPGGVDGASSIDPDEHRDQSEGHATGGGDGDEAAMVSGRDDGRGRGSSREHSMGKGTTERQETASLSSTLGLVSYLYHDIRSLLFLLPRRNRQRPVTYETDIRWALK